MRLSRYGIVFETLRSDHLEMVRLWRNQDYIRERMQFKKLLSRVDQEQWFAQLDPVQNIYWIIRFHDYPIGLIHIKDINIEKGQGEAGIFIGEPSYLEMPQAMLAILFMMELAFYAFGLHDLKAKIHSDNKKAIRFNLNLGYSLDPEQVLGFQYYSVSHSEFESATASLRLGAVKTYGAETRIELTEPTDIWQEKLLNLSKEAKRYFNPS